jgi:hypothetical protein
MSIRDEINMHLGAGRLLQLHLFVPELPERRTIYLTPNLMALLHGPWAEERWERRWYRARQQLDDFIDGLPRDRIFVRSAPRKKSSAFMSRLDPDSDEIWEIRVRDPKPGIRIFGSFLSQDVFVALTAAPHECLRNDQDWDALIVQYKGEWTRHFTTQPFSGAYPHDYISNAVVFD